MEQREIKELALSALVLALAFSIARRGEVWGLGSITVYSIAITLVTVSLGFLLHELGHRFLARHYGSYAEYRMWKQGLGLALLLSFFGLVFAAPGAVMIHSRADLWGRRHELTIRRTGLISLIGPVINVALAVAFFVAGYIYPEYKFLAADGASINMWLALFNMFPIPPLDGSKVFSWDKRIWLVASALIMVLWKVF